MKSGLFPRPLLVGLLAAAGSASLAGPLGAQAARPPDGRPQPIVVATAYPQAAQTESDGENEIAPAQEDDEGEGPVIEIPPPETEPTPTPQPAPPGLGEVPPFPANPLPNEGVLTPTRTERTAGTVGSSFEVIDREQIERSNQQSVLEILRGRLGVNVVQSGGPGRSTSVFMRGANSSGTKVLLDGLPLNNPISPNRLFDFGQLTVDNIERIEVLRGPQSTLYGSDAIGGVINIITRRGEGPPQASLRTTVGAFDTTIQQLGFGGGNENFYYSVGGSYQDSGGFSVLDSNLERDGYHIGAVSARAGWTPSDRLNVDVVVRHNNSNIDIDTFGIDGPRVNLIDQTSAQVQMRGVVLDDLWDQRLSLGTNLNDLQDRRGPFGPSDFSGTLRWLDWQNNFYLSERNTLSVGLNTFEEEGFSTFQSQRRLTNTGVWIQDQHRFFEELYLTAGARWDDYSQAGPAETYRVTGRYRLRPTATTFRASIGTGFRAPTLVELDPFFGNPNLRPEESFGWDYGVEQSFFDDALIVGATYFRNDFTDLIIAQPPNFNPENVGRARASGVEISALAQIDQRTSVAVFYTLTDTVDELTGTPLVRRPRHSVLMTINQRLLNERANLFWSVLYVGEREDLGRVRLDPYTRVDLAATYRVNRYWQLFLRADNLFDEDFQEVAGFNGTPVSVFGGVQLGNW